MKRMLLMLIAITIAACSGSSGTQGANGEQGVQGAQGAQGPQGERGADGVSVVSASLPVGDSHCPTGGSAFSAVTGVTYACNGAEGATGAQGSQGAPGAQGPQGVQGMAGLTGPVGPPGPAGPTGPAGPAGPAGGVEVIAADGSSLGRSYGLSAMTAGTINYPTLFTTAAMNTKVLLVEQPNGLGTPKVLVWRNMYDGSAVACEGGLTLYYTGLDCTGQEYIGGAMPPAGMACVMSNLLVSVSSTVVTNVPYVSFRQGLGSGCQNTWWSNPVMSSGTTLMYWGSATKPAAPLQFVP